MGLADESPRLNVLVVEPDCQTREAFFVYLKIIGCTVRVAENAYEAGRAMEAQRFDVIIADYFLPDGDGATLLRSSIAQQEKAVRILTTAYASKLCPIREDLTGIDEIVRKPFRGVDLRDLIVRHAGTVARTRTAPGAECSAEH